MFEFRNQDRVPTKQLFHLGGPVVAVFKVDHLRRRTTGGGEVDKVGIGGDDDEAVFSRVCPDGFVGREPCESRIKNVKRIGKQLRQTDNELGREIRVKQKLQREALSRPVCEA